MWSIPWLRADRTRRLFLSGVCVVITMSIGCSLVTVKMPGEPLPERDLSMRVLTRQYGETFAQRCRDTANEIAVASGDRDDVTDALRWKISAGRASREAALRTVPSHALLDSWGLAVQMDAFFRRPDAPFGDRSAEASATAARLLEEIEEIADEVLDTGEYEAFSDVVERYAAEDPLPDLSFRRRPIAARWRELERSLDMTAPTVGTTAEAVSDVAERLGAYGRGIPDEVKWQGQLIAMESELQARVTRLQDGLDRIYEAAEETQAGLREAIGELPEDLAPQLDRIDERWGETLTVLAAERAALAADLLTAQGTLDETIERERRAFLEALVIERVAVIAGTREIANDVTDRWTAQLRGLVRDALLLAIVLAAVVLGLPFAFGFLAGRALGRRAAT